MSAKMIARRNWKLAVVLGGAVAVAAGAIPLACSSSPSENSGGQGLGPASAITGNPGSGTGTLGFALTLPGGAAISSVTYDLLNSSGTAVTLPGAPNPGTVAVNNSQSIEFQLGGIPAATGDSISLSASTTGGGTCQGSTSGITVTAGGTQTVTVNMLCSAPGADAGNLFVTGIPSYCGTWTALSSNGNEAYVGESVVLTATATGLNPNNLGYTWTMSNAIGAFGATVSGVGSPGQDEAVGPSDPMQFMCTAVGTTTITLVVDDGPLPDSGSCPSNLSTTTTTVTCDAYPANQVESAWVELTGPNGINGFTGNVAIARALTASVPTDAGANPCPTITINGGTPVQMNLRAAATTSIPARPVNTAPGISAAAIINGAAGGGLGKPALFPVSSCEYQLPAGTTSAVVAGQSLPVPKANPQRIVVIGDTGCRLQTDNGMQSCNDPNPEGTDTPYPFAAIAAAAAAQNPDLVLHVGDYAYRDNECPAGLGYNCGGSPWGFGWDTWEADLFAPGAPLLAAAPWIMTRGNHEQCNRAGQGWYRFLDTQPFDTTDVHTCDLAMYDDPGPLSTSTSYTSCASSSVYGLCSGNWNNPFLVQINTSTQIVVFDTADAKPQSQSVNPAFLSVLDAGLTDAGLITGSKSLPFTSGSLFFTTYASELTTAGNLVGAAPLAFNFWSNHHPIFGYTTGSPPATPIPDFPPVMASVFPDTYFPPSINLAIHGHTHDYQAINFAPITGPDGGPFQPAATLVSGNAGDILDLALPYPMPGDAGFAGQPSIATTSNGTQEFATSDNGPPNPPNYWNPISAAALAAGENATNSDFGYMVLQYNASDAGPGTWTSTEYRADNTVRDICTLFQNGTMSCQSWGIILDDDAGVY
ncbi:MAG: metallophosphoesterase [Polyangiaceae bacterium]